MTQKPHSSALFDAKEYLISGLENQAEWWEHLGDAHRDYASLARAAADLVEQLEAKERLLNLASEMGHNLEEQLEVSRMETWAVRHANSALEADIANLNEQYQAALAALATADREASIVHDALYDKTVVGNSRLHDNEDELSAQSAIWRLHHVVRPFLEVPTPASEPQEDA